MLIDVDGAKIYYVDEGTGKPILMLHGFMGSLDVWNPVAKMLSNRYRVVRYDHRGHGKSEKPYVNYNLDLLLRDLKNIIKKLSLKDFTLVGHCIGGMVALLYSLEKPKELDKIVLVNTTSNMSEDNITRISTYIYSILLSHFYGITVKIKAKLMRRSNVPGYLIDSVLKTPKYVAVPLLNDIKSFNIEERLSEINVPTMVIAGEDDSKFPVWMSERMAEKIRDSTLVVIPSAEHFSMIDKPKEFYSAVYSFVR